MRKPPDKDQAARLVTERDINNSNATLNSLFGTSRTKSWMTASGSHNPVRPTPRASQSSTTPTLPASSLPPNSPSHTSPYSTTDGSHTVNQQQQHNGIQQASNNRPNIPHPLFSYSEALVTQAGEQIGAMASSPRRQPARINENVQPGVFESGNPQSRRETEFSNTNPPSARMALEDATVREPLVPMQTPATQNGHSSPEGHSRFTSQRTVTGNASTSTSTIATAPAPLQADAPQGTRQGSLNNRPNPIQTIYPNSSPRTSAMTAQLPLPSTILAQKQQQLTKGASIAFHTDASNPQKRQRIQQPAMPSLSGRIPLIDAHIASVGGHQNIRADLDRLRFHLLASACREEDIFYIVLHQLFCLWSWNGHELSGAEDLPTAAVLDAGFQILGQLIRNNTDMDPTHLSWFSRFPSPLNDLLRTSVPYRRNVRAVGTFLSKLATDWAPLCMECGQRGYPVLMDELVKRLGLVSSTLQNVVFTASRRNMGVVDEHGGHDMDSLFKRDKLEHQRLALRYNTATPPTEKEINERNQALSRQYSDIYQRVRMAQAQQEQHQIIARRMSEQVAGVLEQPPVVPSNTHQVTILTGAASLNQAAWQQNMPHSPDLSGNWQFNNPHMQPVHRGSTGSPALMARGSGQPSATWSETSSPNIVQNYSPSVPQVLQWPSPIARNNSAQTPNSLQQTGVPLNQENFDPRGIHPQQQMQMNLQQQHPLAAHQQRIINQQNQILSIQPGVQQQYQNTPNPAIINMQQLNQQIWAQQQQIMTQHHAQNATHFPQQGQNIQQRPTLQQLQQLQQHMLSMNHNTIRSNSIPNRQQSDRSQNNSVSNEAHATPISCRSVSLLDANQLTPETIQQQGPRKSQLYNVTPPLGRSLIPPHGYVHPSQPTLPDLTAAHQAHVRSPRLVPIDLSPAPVLEEEDSTRRFYQVVKGFALNPTKIPASTALSKFEFTIPDEAWDLIAQDKFTTTERLPSREFKQGTLQYRLRCIQTKAEVTKCMLSEWSISDTAWPEVVFMEVNGQHLEVRRKNHHGKDLPIDITSFMSQKSILARGSKNVLKFSIPRIRKSKRPTFYFIAVEVIEILQHQQIMDMCTKQYIPANKTIGDIKKSLAGPSGDDDEISIMPDDLTIDLADPFTARIFEIPVRGGSCLHRECFDLETFLFTRNTKPKRQGQPCMIDVWKCPLCGRDARPYTLQVDGFLVSVRASLAGEKNFKGLDVKAIKITPEGKWYAKLEDKPLKRKAPNGLDEDTDDDDDDDFPPRVMAAHPPKPRSNLPNMNGANNHARSRIPTPVEVIDLDE